MGSRPSRPTPRWPVVCAARGALLVERERKRSPFWIALVMAASALLVPASTTAHPQVCAHTHSGVNGELTTCDSPGAVCSVREQNGECGDTMSGLQRCICVRVGGTSCPEESFLIFNPNVAGLPGPGDTRLYTVSMDPANQSAVFSGLDLLEDFSAVSNPLQGSLTLVYGSFSNPQIVPVTLTNLSLTLAPFTLFGVSTGTISMDLGAAGSQSLVYDSTTRMIQPAAGVSGIDTEIDYNLNFGLNDPTTTWFGGVILNDGSGRAHVVIGSDADLADFPSAVPILSTGGVVALTLLLLFLMYRVATPGRRQQEGPA